GRPSLADVRPQPLPERGVEEVGRGVIPHRREARHVIDLGLDPGSRLDAVERSVELHRLVVANPVDVSHTGAATVPPDLARIRDLAAALGVEGALLELDQRVAVVRAHGEQAGVGAELLVADEARGCGLRGEPQYDAVMILRAVFGP